MAVLFGDVWGWVIKAHYFLAVRAAEFLHVFGLDHVILVRVASRRW